MNGRQMYRKFAQSKDKEATEFVEIQSEMYQNDTLITKDNKGRLEETSINYKDVVNFILKTY